MFLRFFACMAISVKSLSKTEPNYVAFIYYFNTLIGLGTIFLWVKNTNINRFYHFYNHGLIWKYSESSFNASYRLAEASLIIIKYLSLVFGVFGFLI